MSATATVNPVRLVDDLDPEQIRRELDELERREDALRILYRAAVARRRRRETDQRQTATA